MADSHGEGALAPVTVKPAGMLTRTVPIGPPARSVTVSVTAVVAPSVRVVGFAVTVQTAVAAATARGVSTDAPIAKVIAATTGRIGASQP